MVWIVLHVLQIIAISLVVTKPPFRTGSPSTFTLVQDSSRWSNPHILHDFESWPHISISTNTRTHPSLGCGIRTRRLFSIRSLKGFGNALVVTGPTRGSWQFASADVVQAQIQVFFFRGVLVGGLFVYGFLWNFVIRCKMVKKWNARGLHQP